jgi:hypothetical protein
MTVSALGTTVGVHHRLERATTIKVLRFAQNDRVDGSE